MLFCDIILEKKYKVKVKSYFPAIKKILINVELVRVFFAVFLKIGVNFSTEKFLYIFKLILLYSYTYVHTYVCICM